MDFGESREINKRKALIMEGKVRTPMTKIVQVDFKQFFGRLHCPSMVFVSVSQDPDQKPKKRKYKHKSKSEKRRKASAAQQLGDDDSSQVKTNSASSSVSTVTEQTGSLTVGDAKS